MPEPSASASRTAGPSRTDAAASVPDHPPSTHSGTFGERERPRGLATLHICAILACMQASTAHTQDATAVRLATLMRRLLTTGGSEFLRRLDDQDLSLSQVKTVHLLADARDEDLTLKDLGDELGLSLPAVSRAVDGLVRRGLVDRAEDAEDRRFKRVRATAAGSDLVRELMEVRVAGLADFVASLDARQRKALDAALALIVSEDPA